MSKLLKLQFFRIFKDKVFYILFSVGIVISILSNILMLSIFASGGSSDGGVIMANAALSAFSYSSMPLIVVGLWIILFFSKENRYGTMRNQIVSGFSRPKIFFSIYFVVLILGVGAVLISQGINIGITALYGYQFPVNNSDAQNLTIFIEKLICCWMTLIFYFSLITFCLLISRSIGMAISFNIVIPEVFLLLTLMIYGVTMTSSGSSSVISHIFDFIPYYQNGAICSLSIFGGIGSSDSGRGLFTFDNYLFYKTIITDAILIAGCLWGGSAIFSRRDLK